MTNSGTAAAIGGIMRVLRIQSATALVPRSLKLTRPKAVGTENSMARTVAHTVTTIEFRRNGPLSRSRLAKLSR